MTATNGTPEILAAIEIEMKPGWQFYYRTPGEYGVAPIFDWLRSENVDSVTVHWPVPTRYTYSTVPLISTLGYKDAFMLPITIAAKNPNARAELRLRLEYATCNEFCIIDTVELVLDIPNGIADETPDKKRILHFLELSTIE